RSYEVFQVQGVTTSGNRLAHWRPLVAKGHHELICVHMCLCCLCVPSPVSHCDLCSHLFPIVCSHLSRVFMIVTSLYQLGQGSSTFFSPRTPWLKETLRRDPHPRRPKFRPDIHIFYLELSVSHTQTLPYTCLNRITNHHHTNYKSQSFYLQ